LKDGQVLLSDDSNMLPKSYGCKAAMALLKQSEGNSATWRFPGKKKLILEKKISKEDGY